MCDLFKIVKFKAGEEPLYSGRGTFKTTYEKSEKSVILFCKNKS